jgi:hypothetical protein
MYESILKLAELQDGGELSPATEEAIALAYADRHRLELRYVAAWSRWLSYDGASWKLDDTLHAFDRARDICREVALECEKSGDGKHDCIGKDRCCRRTTRIGGPAVGGNSCPMG